MERINALTDAPAANDGQKAEDRSPPPSPLPDNVPSKKIVCEECGRAPAYFLAVGGEDPQSEAIVSAIGKALGYIPTPEYLQAEREIRSRNLCKLCLESLSLEAHEKYDSRQKEAPSQSGQSEPDFAVSEDAGNLVTFPAKKPRRGRKKKDATDTIRVEHVKPSKGTWAFRLRWTEADGSRPTVYISRVDDKRFKLITRRKVTYEQFKKALIASYRMSGSVRTDRATGGSASRVL